MRSKDHEKFLVDQYNRNRKAKDHVKNMAELNRALLDNEIKAYPSSSDYLCPKCKAKQNGKTDT